MAPAERAAARAGVLALCLLAPALPPVAARAEERPLAATDWLSRSVAQPQRIGAAAPLPQTHGGAAPAPAPPGSRSRLPVPRDEPPVARTVGTGAVSIAPLGAQIAAESTGLLPAARAGLPPGLWGATPEADLVRLLRADRPEALPALRTLLMTLLVAELDPPRIGAGPPGTPPGQVLFLARIDRLLDLGALEPAFAMLNAAGPTSPERFRRLFDTALLLGAEDRACEIMAGASMISPSIPARIFCLARAGQWEDAHLLFANARALGDLPADLVPLLAQFLDDALVDMPQELPPPIHPSPLVFRMMEAVGQPMPTTLLPLAFAQADLREDSGWKARIEAAERLARAGTVEANRLLGLYTEREPAASGSVWERAQKVGALEAALETADPQAVTLALAPAVAAMEEVELEVVLAELFGARLGGIALEGEAGALAFRLGLLSPQFDTIARAHRPAGAEEAFLAALARGATAGMPAADSLSQAIKDAFDAPPRPAAAPPAPEATPAAAPRPVAAEVPAGYRDLVAQDRRGEALLRAVDEVALGAQGDYPRLTAALSLLRAMGLETVARRTALQLLLLERRG